MSHRIRSLALLGIVITLAAIGTMSCSKHSSAPTAPTTPTVHKYPLSNGTWRVAGTLTPTTGSCYEADSWVDTVIVVGGVPVGSDPFPPATFNVTGTRVTQAYADTFEIDSNCSLREVASGSGTVNSSSLTMTYDVSVTVIGDCSSHGITGTCRARVVLTGTRIATTPSLSSYPSGRTVSPARASWFVPWKPRSTK